MSLVNKAAIHESYLSHIGIGVGILGFPKTEIERKPQRNFHSDFIKLMREHKVLPGQMGFFHGITRKAFAGTHAWEDEA